MEKRIYGQVEKWTCPKDYPDKNWCLDCGGSKENLCDWPHRVGGKRQFIRGDGEEIEV